MQLLLSRAGLVLNPGQVADLVLAWRQVAGLIASITQDRPLADDMALRFRLLSPSGAAAAPRGRPAAKAAPKVKAKPKPPAKAKAKAKRRAPRSAPRTTARRGR